MAESLAYVDTIYSADSIECCPFEGYQDLFVCGTYQIVPPSSPQMATLDTDTEGASHKDQDEDDAEEEDQPRATVRVGRLLLFKVIDDVDGNGASLKEIYRVETPAILDTKWCPSLDHEGRPELAVGDAKGHVRVYSLVPGMQDGDTPILQERQVIEVADEGILCLSLDYSHRLQPNLSPGQSQVVVSLSSGSLAILTPVHTLEKDSYTYEVTSSWHAHDYEPWIVSWDNWDIHTLWSGGDDCKLKRWDVRDTTRPTFVDKNFEAGVTTITSSPHTPHLLAVGSYDENIRIYDTRSPLTALHTIHVGGGIWRTRFHPSIERKGDLLIAAMHDGFKVVRLDISIEADEDPEKNSRTIVNGGIIKEFKDHTSLAYGADWARLPSRYEDDTLIATCSFYDHALHLWRG